MIPEITLVAGVSVTHFYSRDLFAGFNTRIKRQLTQIYTSRLCDNRVKVWNMLHTHDKHCSNRSEMKLATYQRKKTLPTTSVWLAHVARMNGLDCKSVASKAVLMQQIATIKLLNKASSSLGVTLPIHFGPSTWLRNSLSFRLSSLSLRAVSFFNWRVPTSKQQSFSCFRGPLTAFRH